MPRVRELTTNRGIIDVRKQRDWEYEERELTQDEYSQYLIAMEQAKAINEHSDNEAIDNYTMQLMNEGGL